ncbi:MAG: MoaD/ThiS family protein [Chloroflexi bacterium]|nr:MoaD/ThiS family protein [Chloroflexota bacterium]
MGKVRLEIPDWMAKMLGKRGPGSMMIEKEFAEGETIGSLLGELAQQYPNFRNAVYNPDLGEVSDQLVFVVNETLLQCQDVTAVKLKDGDRITLLPQFAGG